MKITKRTKALAESVKLTEAEDEEVAQPAAADGIITKPEDSSITDIAKEVKGAVITDTQGAETVTNKDAAELAAEIKADAAAVEADAVVVGQPFKLDQESRHSTYTLNNRLTKALDAALKVAERTHRNRYIKSSHSYPNILVEGLPGSGKTSLVKNWARLNGINLFEIDAKNDDLKAMIDGYVIKDPNNPGAVTKAASSALNSLNKPRSVLFLDEFNRQQNLGIRGSLLTLVQDHTILGANNERVNFDNFLFTVVAINPYLPSDKGATKLIGAEKDRYFMSLRGFDSDPAITKEYFKVRWGNTDVKDVIDAVKEYNNGVFDEESVLAIEDSLRRENLGLFIVSHPLFKYDDLDDYAECERDEGRRLFSQRALTTLLEDTPEITASPDAGQQFIDGIKDLLEPGNYGQINAMNLLDKSAQMLIDIIDDYPIPTRDLLFSKSPFKEVKALANNNVITNAEKANNSASATSKNNDEEADSDKDANDDMWNKREVNADKQDSQDWGADLVQQAINDMFN